MMSQLDHVITHEAELLPLAHSSMAILPSTEASHRLENNLSRMFRDPYQLEKTERTALIADLRTCIELRPDMPELRVLLGMAMCVDLQAQQAMEVLRDAVDMSPDNFVARLKFGELLMRLRICDQAAEHTQQAARLATNDVQVEMARKQAKTIREMQRAGIERGGFNGFFSRMAHWRTQLTPRGRGLGRKKVEQLSA
jgi:hypothetical protein